MPNSQLISAVLALISANNANESKRIIEEQRDLLLTNDGEQLLNDWLAQSQGDYARTVQERLTLLARCRKEGISGAFAEPVRSRPPRQKVQQAILALVEANSARQRQQLIQQQQDILLSDAADEFLAAWIENVEDFEEDEVIRNLRDCRTLLAKCRDEGIEAAFAHQAPRHPSPSAQPTAELSALLNEIRRLTRPQQMPRRIELCQTALTLVERDTQPEQWAWLQNKLGISLLENPLGDRADNLEQAINHFQQSLEVYTHQATPKEWAGSINNLANAYLYRIRGERADNLERAISLYEQSQEVYTRQATPKEWATSMNNLANAYLYRIRGERADNLERAIDYYEQSLEVVTRQATPKEWALSCNNLAAAYLYRIKGERADNLERAISLSEQSLEVYTRQAFPEQWATSMNNLALAYRNRIKGERADNLERAIDYLKLSLDVYTRQAFPEQWAGSMNNLANAYLYRIRGERAENLERAIDYLEQSLEVYTRQAFPYEWATSMNNLAEAYRERIKGERADNLERAIDYYEQSLEVYTRQGFPFEWARSMNNLANAYSNRIRGERADNIERAIDYYEQLQEVWTHQAFPEKWARSMNNLAAAYLYRIKGERAENLERAIDYCEQSLEVYTRQAFPEEWARSMNNLALAYLDRIRGERTENLERAIDYYEQSLEVYTRQAFPYEWARSMGGLAAAYIKGERADNFERAICLYEQAQEVWTRQAFPYEWAMSINNLALAYLDRVRGEWADNIERGIDYLKQSQEVYTHQAFPEQWATSMNSLAAAYNSRIRGERAENLERAIDCLKQALEVRTPQSFPQDGRNTANALGHLLYDEGRFGEARQAFVTGHEAVEALRGEVLREGARRKLGEENAGLYARLVFCCLHDANADEEAAFEYAAAGKGRAFVDMLGSTRFDLFAAEADDSALAADLQEYRELRQQIDNLRSRLTGQSAQVDEERKEQEWEALRNLQRQELERWEDLSYKYPALTATQSAPWLSVAQAQALATDVGATLVEFVQHMGGWSAFVVTSEAASAVRHVSLSDVNDEFIQKMVIEWVSHIEDSTYHNEASYQALDEWYKALIMPLKPHLPPSGKVVLAPAGVLHLMPLSIARNPKSKRYLCDEYALSFAPSLAALRVTLEEARKKGMTRDESLGSLLAVAYPGEFGQSNYLSHALPEARAIAKLFPKPKVTSLYRQAATPQAVVEQAKGQAVAHFSCHGTFDSDLPEQSGLALSGGYLTVQRIITELRLSDARLATLSACLTHWADVRGGEEHVGLVQSVLTAGARSVVASLWSVPSGATRVLFKQFYSAVAKGQAPAQALTEAMRHLRQQPDREHPFYWAAFQVSGLGYDLEVGGGATQASRGGLQDEVPRT